MFACILKITNIKFKRVYERGEVVMHNENLRQRALEQLEKDAQTIIQLIKVQMDNLTAPQCPVFEEVLDTQMFGLSKEITFAIKLGLIDKVQGREILDDLEQKVSEVHEAYMAHQNRNKSVRTTKDVTAPRTEPREKAFENPEARDLKPRNT